MSAAPATTEVPKETKPEEKKPEPVVVNDTTKKEEVKATPAVKDTKEKENEAPKNSTAAAAKPKTKEEASNAEGTKLPTLKDQFKAFSKFGDSKSDEKHLTLSQSDKWMKQAKVIDKTITTTDTAIHFKKFKQMKMTYPTYETYLQDLAKAKNIEVETIKTKLRGCGLPGTSGTTAVVKNSAVDRLTDTKKFTGSHKVRTDPPKGKVTPSPRK